MKSTAAETVEAALGAIQARDGELHAWQAVDAEFARRQARALDAGPPRGPLHGIPVGVKDIFDTADLPTEYGSPIYKGHRPAADAACVAAGTMVANSVVTVLPRITAPAARAAATHAASAAGRCPL